LASRASRRRRLQCRHAPALCGSIRRSLLATSAWPMSAGLQPGQACVARPRRAHPARVAARRTSSYSRHEVWLHRHLPAEGGVPGARQAPAPRRVSATLYCVAVVRRPSAARFASLTAAGPPFTTRATPPTPPLPPLPATTSSCTRSSTPPPRPRPRPRPPSPPAAAAAAARRLMPARTRSCRAAACAPSTRAPS
jgi:hypothetical protein